MVILFISWNISLYYLFSSTRMKGHFFLLLLLVHSLFFQFCLAEKSLAFLTWLRNVSSLFFSPGVFAEKLDLTRVLSASPPSSVDHAKHPNFSPAMSLENGRPHPVKVVSSFPSFISLKPRPQMVSVPTSQFLSSLCLSLSHLMSVTRFQTFLAFRSAVPVTP